MKDQLADHRFLLREARRCERLLGRQEPDQDRQTVVDWNHFKFKDSVLFLSFMTSALPPSVRQTNRTHINPKEAPVSTSRQRRRRGDFLETVNSVAAIELDNEIHFILRARPAEIGSTARSALHFIQL